MFFFFFFNYYVILKILILQPQLNFVLYNSNNTIMWNVFLRKNKFHINKSFEDIIIYDKLLQNMVLWYNIPVLLLIITLSFYTITLLFDYHLVIIIIFIIIMISGFLITEYIVFFYFNISYWKNQILLYTILNIFLHLLFFYLLIGFNLPSNKNKILLINLWIIKYHI